MKCMHLLHNLAATHFFTETCHVLITSVVPVQLLFHAQKPQGAGQHHCIDGLAATDMLVEYPVMRCFPMSLCVMTAVCSMVQVEGEGECAEGPHSH